MAIISISRDTLTQTLNLVRIVSTDSLAVISASGYLTSQAAAIAVLNSGIWNWLGSDEILINYGAVVNADGSITYGSNGFYQVSADASSLVAKSNAAAASVTLSAAQVLAAYATPQLIIPAPGAGKAIMLINSQLVTEVSTAFAGGGVAILQYGATVHGAGTNALSATIPAAEITAATSQIYTQTGYVATTVTATSAVTNQGIYFSNATGAFTGGAGSTVTPNLQYVIIAAV